MKHTDYQFPTPEELEKLRDTDIRTVDASALTDIRDVKPDSSLPQEERLAEYLRQIKNPYCYRCGDVVVKLTFAGKATLEECLRDYFRAETAE